MKAKFWAVLPGGPTGARSPGEALREKRHTATATHTSFIEKLNRGRPHILALLINSTEALLINSTDREIGFESLSPVRGVRGRGLADRASEFHSFLIF
jgi:hypothetical protein